MSRTFHGCSYWFSWCAIVCGCTHGPVQDAYIIDHLMVRPNTHVFAAAIRHERFREPTGLSTFPDGGARMIVAQDIAFFLADVDSGRVFFGASMPAPVQVWNAFESRLLGWDSASVFAVLTGCRMEQCAGGVPTRLFVRVARGSEPMVVDRLPGTIETPPGMLARAPGETTYLRVSASHDSILLRTEDGAPFVARFAVTAGALRPIHGFP